MLNSLSNCVTLLKNEAIKNEDLTGRQIKNIENNLFFETSFEDNIILTVPNNEILVNLNDTVVFFIQPIIKNYYNGEYSVFLKIKKERRIENNKIIKIPAVEIIAEEEKNKINKKQTFSNFVIAKENRVPFAACQLAAENPGKKENNPLYIFGNPGMGKTHLLNSIANYAWDKAPLLKILYLTAEDFVQEFVSSSAENKFIEFDKKFENLDILLIDDIQYFQENMGGSINAFFNIFEKMVKKNKQIVITADVSPDELKNLHRRLISRFKSNLYYGIEKPNYELKKAIIERNIMNLQNQYKKEKIEISHDIVETIANADLNIREIEGILKNVFFYCKINNEQPTIKVIENFLCQEEKKQEISPEKIVIDVAKYYNVNKEEITKNNRIPKIALARRVSMYLCKQLTKYNTSQIGSFFNKDHSTVVVAAKKISQEIHNNKQFKKEIERIMEIVHKD
jgi:chromosomal replication initiator protein